MPYALEVRLSSSIPAKCEMGRWMTRCCNTEHGARRLVLGVHASKLEGWCGASVKAAVLAAENPQARSAVHLCTTAPARYYNTHARPTRRLPIPQRAAATSSARPLSMPCRYRALQTTKGAVRSESEYKCARKTCGACGRAMAPSKRKVSTLLQCLASLTRVYEARCRKTRRDGVPNIAGRRRLALYGQHLPSRATNLRPRQYICTRSQRCCHHAQVRHHTQTRQEPASKC